MKKPKIYYRIRRHSILRDWRRIGILHEHQIYFDRLEFKKYANHVKKHLAVIGLNYVDTANQLSIFLAGEDLAGTQEYTDEDTV